MSYQELKEEQKEVLFNFLNCKDVFVVLPTGYRKISVMVFYQYILITWNNDKELLQ
jgi:superfamily II DNA helicase RecQ